MKTYRYSIFPSLVNEIECENFVDIKFELLDWIYDYKFKNIGIERSNRKGWQSDSNLHLNESFSRFKTYIELNIFELIKIYNCKFKLNAMWVNINSPGSYNVCHDHPGSILSGVIWIKSPNNCGKLAFQSNISFMEYELLKHIDDDIAKKFNYYDEFQFIPVEGTLIIFPSHLLHDVEPNESDEDRISISFNLTTCD
jgi:uncharacterized protein (TIGR02466 family)